VTSTISDAIAREETKLAHLDAERKTVLDRIQKLREQVATSKSVIISNQESFSLGGITTRMRNELTCTFDTSKLTKAVKQIFDGSYV